MKRGKMKKIKTNSALNPAITKAAIKSMSPLANSGLLDYCNKINNSSMVKTAEKIANIANKYNGLLSKIVPNVFSDNLASRIISNYENNENLTVAANLIAQKTSETSTNDINATETINSIRQLGSTKINLEYNKIELLSDICNRTDELIKQTAENQNLTTSILIESQQTNQNTQIMVEEAKKASLDNKKSVKLNIAFTLITLLVTLFFGCAQIYRDVRTQQAQTKSQDEKNVIYIQKITNIENSIQDLTKQLLQQQAILIELQKEFLLEIEQLNKNISSNKIVATRLSKTKSKK